MNFKKLFWYVFMSSLTPTENRVTKCVSSCLRSPINCVLSHMRVETQRISTHHKEQTKYMLTVKLTTVDFLCNMFRPFTISWRRIIYKIINVVINRSTEFVLINPSVFAMVVHFNFVSGVCCNVPCIDVWKTDTWITTTCYVITQKFAVFIWFGVEARNHAWYLDFIRN